MKSFNLSRVIILGFFFVIFLFLIFFVSLKIGALIFLLLFSLFFAFKSGKFSLNDIVLLLLFCSILLPPLRFDFLSIAIRPELVLVFLAWILFIWGKLAKGGEINIKFISIYKWFFIFGACILLSIFISWIFKGFFPVGRDFFEIAKVIEYFLIFALVANLKVEKEGLRRYYFFLLIFFLISAIFGIFQYFDFFHSFNKSFIEYVNPNQLDGWLLHKRVIGIFGNPNEFGILMAIAAVFSLAGFLWEKNKKIKIIMLLFFALFAFNTILTLSRSAFICLAVGIVFMFYKYQKKFKSEGIVRVLFFVLPIIILLSLIFFSIAPQKFLVRFEFLKSGNDTSFKNRIDSWKEAINIWKDSPFFGWGPAKDKMSTIVDNEWILLLRRYGIFGVLIFILWFLQFYRGIGKIQRENKNNLYLEIISISLQVSLIMIAIYMIPAAFYHSLQAMPILMTLLGLVYSQKINSKKIL